MVDFFDKKEDVLDFQLTEYGKRLLQLGNLKPEYYAFFDEDILYDTEAAGFSEAQNDAARRIKYETPALKVQPNTTGVETRVNEFLHEVTGGANENIFTTPISENSVSFVNAFQSTPHFAQKFFLGSDAIGNSDLKTEYAPAWHINCIANNITSTQTYYTVNLTASNTGLANGIVRSIPQLDFEVDYKTFLDSAGAFNNTTSPDIVQLSNDYFEGDVELYVKEDYLALQVLEKNTDFLKENFDVQVYEVQTDNNGTEMLTQLQFLKEDELLQPTTDTNVEHYMNILTDAEIPDSIAEKLGIDIKSLRGNSVRLRLSRDLYQTDNEEPC